MQPRGVQSVDCDEQVDAGWGVVKQRVWREIEEAEIGHVENTPFPWRGALARAGEGLGWRPLTSKRIHTWRFLSMMDGRATGLDGL